MRDTQNMIRSSFPISILIFLSLFLSVRGQGRAPHGLAEQTPQAFSPAAYDFFHPHSHQQQHPNQHTSRAHSPIPLAAQVQRGDASHPQQQGNSHLSTPSEDKTTRVGPGIAVMIVFGFVFMVLLAMGAFYVVATRRANSNRAKNAHQTDYV